MQDKLQKILNIKIEAIETNIDNLNYLNNELDKNNSDLDYINSKIALFNEGDILEFDSILIDDFNKIISMINPIVKETFDNKACNYQGIMYIIKGIRDGISLELTSLQEDAIKLFIKEMNAKSDELKETISNLLDSKEKLPETNLDVLEASLKDYEEIISKLTSNSYLTEIEEITDALDFANLPLLEKIDIFSNILRYNRDIYVKTNDKEETTSPDNFDEIKITTDLKPNNDFFEEKDFDLPTFSLNKINEKKDDKEEIFEDKEDETLKTNLNNTIDLQEIIERIDEKIKKLDSHKLDEDELDKNKEVENKLEEKDDLEETLEKKIDEKKIEDSINDRLDFNKFKLNLDNDLVLPSFNHENNKLESIKKDTSLSSDTNKDKDLDTHDSIDSIYESLNSEVPADTLNTGLTEPKTESLNVDTKQDLEEVKEEKLDNLPESNNLNLDLTKPLPTFVEPTVTPFEVSNTNVETDSVLETEPKQEFLNNQAEKEIDTTQKINDILDKYEVREVFSNNPNILENVLKQNPADVERALTIIKTDLTLKEDEFKKVLEVILETMPGIFTVNKILTTFINDIEFYKEHKINLINLFDNYRELLVIDTNVLKDNYDIVKNYQIELTNDNVKYLLCNKKVLSNLDYYIEAIGHEKPFLGKEQVFDGIEYINKYPYKLNMISNIVLMKLRYSTENNLRIYGSKPGVLAGEISNPKVDILTLPDEYRNMYFNHEYEFVDRSEMEKLIDDIKNDTSMNLSIDENIMKLDNLYKISDLRYKINNLYFSRIKTIRIYNYLKGRNIPSTYALIIALTYQSVIKKDEYKLIENEITKLLGGI